MKTWNDIKTVPLAKDNPVVVRQAHGVNRFGCYHATEHASGIIELVFDGKESFQWDGKTYLIKVTHWRDHDIGDLLNGVNQEQPV
jgi:hypothetical protein